MMTDPDQFLADPRLNNGRSDWFEVLNELTSQALAQLITTPSVALLDVPTHMNVGDSLIWRGELHHLKRINVRVSYESDAADFRQEFLDGTLDDTVLLHGGGNFGDIWPKFQEFRESVVKNNHHRSFIQLPQSVYFTSRDGYRRANDVFGNHPSFLLLVRDRSSFNRVVKNMPDVRVTYLPDMALGNEDLRAPARQAASRSPLALARTDSESAGTIDIPGLRRVDWGLSGVRRIQWRSARIAGKISRAAPNSVARALLPLVRRGYRRMLQLNVDAGVRLVDRASVVVTDRLHAQVLAGLRQVPCIALDNNYGKIGALYRDYAGRFENSTLIEDRELLTQVFAAYCTSVPRDATA